DDKKVDKHKKYSKSNLSSRELNLLNDMLFPDDIKISFEDICGLDNAKNFLKKNVCNILDLRSHDIPAFPKSAFPPSGILIHGPPGCGKTMICTALAKMC
ncbi:MAG: ATPase AAA domain-containing protein 1, partial [Paramarteilia canceri]